MATFSATVFHHRPFSSCFLQSSPRLSHPTNHAQSIIPPLHAAADPDKDKVAETANDEPPKAVAATPKPPKKPVYSMKKGQIVRVDKEKYLNSINYLSVGHPPYYKGLDYIYEDRGEVLDIRIFETGEYALNYTPAKRRIDIKFRSFGKQGPLDSNAVYARRVQQHRHACNICKMLELGSSVKLIFHAKKIDYVDSLSCGLLELVKSPDLT